MIRVELPFHLQRLAGTGREVQVGAQSAPTQRSILDALEAKYPMLKGTIRDHGTLKRRAFLRFFASGQDFSDRPDAPLPEPISKGTEPFIVLGAIAGG